VAPEISSTTAGRSVLVNGAGGAVGGYAVQLARRAGAIVTATASERSAGRLRSYGADRIIDRTVIPLTRAVAKEHFDVVLDLVRSTEEEARQLAALAADGGAFVSTTFPDFDDAGRGVRTVKVYARSDAARLAELVALVDAGDLKISVAGRRPLTDLPGVHDESVARRLAGKTVLIP
jgi:NADPH:quinone reductase-like Zn-dependent oxidoreductase